MHYWLVVARLFEPLVEAEADMSPPASSLHREDSPQEIVALAKTCLFTLVRLYYSCHGSDGYDFFAILLARFIGFAALGNVLASNDMTAAVREAYESSVVLCAGILYGQSQMTYLAEIVFRVMHKNLPASIANTLNRVVNVSDIDERRTELASRQVQAEWPIDVVRPVRSADDRRLGNLFRAIAELSIDDGSTTPDASSQPSSPTS